MNRRLIALCTLLLWLAPAHAAPTLSLSFSTRQKVRVNFPAAINGATCPTARVEGQNPDLVLLEFDPANCRFLYVKARGVTGAVTIFLETTIHGATRRATIAVDVTPDGSESPGLLTANPPEALP